MKTNTCAGCIWEDACQGATKCGDYTPYDTEEIAMRAYEQDLWERIDDYAELIREYGDGNDSYDL